jgi:hypothetical protein
MQQVNNRNCVLQTPNLSFENILFGSIFLTAEAMRHTEILPCSRAQTLQVEKVLMFAHFFQSDMDTAQ